jgi:uncharacterized protein YbcV (DUF1398 family)
LLQTLDLRFLSNYVYIIGKTAIIFKKQATFCLKKSVKIFIMLSNVALVFPTISLILFLQRIFEAVHLNKNLSDFLSASHRNLAYHTIPYRNKVFIVLKESRTI